MVSALDFRSGARWFEPVLSLDYVHSRGDFSGFADESGTFWYRIHFAVYTQMSESETKTSRFGRDSGDFESEIQSEYFASDYCLNQCVVV